MVTFLTAPARALAGQVRSRRQFGTFSSPQNPHFNHVLLTSGLGCTGLRRRDPRKRRHPGLGPGRSGPSRPRALTLAGREVGASSFLSRPAGLGAQGRGWLDGALGKGLRNPWGLRSAVQPRPPQEPLHPPVEDEGWGTRGQKTKEKSDLKCPAGSSVGG